MDRTLFVVAAAVAAAAWAAGFASPGRDSSPAPAPTDRGRPLWALLPAVLGFLLCLPTSAPFAPGLALGWGLLIGGIAATLSLMVASRTGDGAAAAAPAVVAATLPLFVLRPGLLDGLGGVALGWVSGFACAAAAGVALPPVAALSGAVMAVAAAIGVLRTGDMPSLPRDSWCLAPLAVPAVAAGLLALGRLAGKGALTLLWKALAALGAGLALWLATRRVGGDWPVPVVGLGGVALWAAVRAAWGDGTGRERLLLSGLCVLGAELLSSEWLQNFGPGLLAVGMLAGALILPPVRGGAAPLAFAAALATVRLTGLLWSTEIRGLGLGEQFALGGALLGALLPAAADALAQRERRPVLPILLAGTLLIGPAAALVLVFGFPAVLPLQVGAALACAGAVAARRADRTAALALALTLLLLGAADPLGTLAGKGRKERLRTAIVLVAVPAVLVAAAEATRRRPVRGVA